MYTDLICKAVIKDEYCDKINKKINEDRDWKDLFDHYFVDNIRADFIPYGEYGIVELNNKIFYCKCSLKNYADTYDDFFEFLKTISDEILEFKTNYEEAYDWNYDYTIKKIYWKNYLTDQYDTETIRME